jgi:putative addiction module component (TIGR02574 family)
MNSQVEKIRREALSLSASERASIAHDLILSLDDPDDYILDQKKEFEIRDRIKNIKAGKAKVELFDDAISEIAIAHCKRKPDYWK